jgi:hypothetical protein
MSLYKSLPAQGKAKVEAKLAALRKKTGRSWSYQIMDKQWQEEITPPLLEISVDGKCSRPIPLPQTTDSPADVLCHELDQYAAQQA